MTVIYVYIHLSLYLPCIWLSDLNWNKHVRNLYVKLHIQLGVDLLGKGNYIVYHGCSYTFSLVKLKGQLRFVFLGLILVKIARNLNSNNKTRNKCISYVKPDTFSLQNINIKINIVPYVRFFYSPVTTKACFIRRS